MNILEIAGFIALVIVCFALVLWAMGSLKWELTMGDGKDAKKYGNINKRDP